MKRGKFFSGSYDFFRNPTRAFSGAKRFLIVCRTQSFGHIYLKTTWFDSERIKLSFSFKNLNAIPIGRLRLRLCLPTGQLGGSKTNFWTKWAQNRVKSTAKKIRKHAKTWLASLSSWRHRPWIAENFFQGVTIFFVTQPGSFLGQSDFWSSVVRKVLVISPSKPHDSTQKEPNFHFLLKI